ncbi:MAG: hypothetical protein IIX12_00790 [Alistipes sp.]|nr:hypothetical protein [Alistipes sp.]MBR0330115.1 hypothetical protein [Alistipes sp.]
MKKAIYERPSTLRFSVALEGNFAGSADVENSSNAENGRIDHQSVNTGFETDFTFGDSNWD